MNLYWLSGASEKQRLYVTVSIQFCKEFVVAAQTQCGNSARFQCCIMNAIRNPYGVSTVPRGFSVELLTDVPRWRITSVEIRTGLVVSSEVPVWNQ
jgi:hypothetical protein